MKIFLSMISLINILSAFAQPGKEFSKTNFDKIEMMIPMRDGIRLYTAVYTPKDQSEKYPFLIERTPYSAGPYGDTMYRRLGSADLIKEKFIFVFQDVRGRYKSEGKNLEVTPHIALKKNKKEVDESSDTYDTVEWLLKNIKNNNGRVGIYGISYPGFYASASLPGAHPAIKAVSPQAPVSDEFIGDDANHNGAFFLLDNFAFMNYFGKPSASPVEDYESNIFKYNSTDAYAFFMDMGPLKNTQSEKYFNHKSYIWNEYLQHDTYDDYWKSRNIRQHLKNITIPTLVVGGWFDAEDLFGALQTYISIEKQSINNQNRLVMGPWTHGAWAGADWNKFGPLNFGINTSKYFQDSLQLPFFTYYLKNKGNFNASEATVFETGTNIWKKYTSWPPVNTVKTDFYFGPKNSIQTNKPAESGNDDYVSDPNKPIPYTDQISGYRNNEYMVEDQRFAAIRPDVVFYKTSILENDVTLSGEIIADLKVKLNISDADFIVKLIDVYPDSMKGFYNKKPLAGYQQMVRCEVIRGKFRNSFETPQPFIPGRNDEVKLILNDVAHTFKKGHAIMVQIQSSWFPLTDRNPQKFMRIFDAVEKDFTKGIINILYGGDNASKITLPILKY